MTSTEFTTVAADRASKVLAFDSAGEISVAQELGSFQGNWAASTAYVQRDIIKDTSNGKGTIYYRHSKRSIGLEIFIFILFYSSHIC